ncbi:sensor histidine kinase [Kutzneria albida]|uniref:histidine kinase n=1 Tax=Kutzneria albida DSM 43870 TaxID=1449976 RepID=W5WKN1_9PSEU|nr:HAMP domain-containing sensor histidine kinase [Kutzneria albida]AHI01423.1 hypothetical protein KALB_8065 [Kutzneria albida DSM 43870]
MRAGTSLRGRLVCGVIVLAALGMAIVDTASLVALRVYFRSLADTSLTAAQGRIAHQVRGRPLSINSGQLQDLVPVGFVVVLLDDSGRAVTRTRSADPPELPATVDTGFAAEPITLSSAGPEYRAQQFALGEHIQFVPDAGPPVRVSAAILAESLGPTAEVLNQLLLFELAATGVALVGIALLSLGALRVGLRPLREMAATASGIAAGDLSQRMEVADVTTEIGQVATALNEAFDARSRSEERLRQFVADASHELRTPLTTIRGWAELHQHGLADEQLTARAMSRIQHEATRMQATVGELLLLAELDQGRRLAREPVDLGALAVDAVADARAVDQQRRVEAELHGEMTVLGDENRLREVVQNLVGNALNHTPSDTSVRVSVRGQDGAVELVVADEGPGMDPDTAARAFERFFRGDQSRSPGTAGSGLGLSIVESIVRAHGGTVGLCTGPGEGSVFTVRFSSAP